MKRDAERGQCLNPSLQNHLDPHTIAKKMVKMPQKKDPNDYMFRKMRGPQTLVKPPGSLSG